MGLSGAVSADGCGFAAANPCSGDALTHPVSWGGRSGLAEEAATARRGADQLGPAEAEAALPDEQELAPEHRAFLLGGDHRAFDFGEEHGRET